MEKKIVVPDGMLKAAIPFWWVHMHSALEAALRWQTENPPIPTLPQLRAVEMAAAHEPNGSTGWLSDVLQEWVRRMYDSPENVESTETIEISHYESGTHAAGSVAVLKDGRRLVSKEAWLQMEGIVIEPREVEPLVMYIMRHFDDAEQDPRTLLCRAQAAVADYREHERRNTMKSPL